MTPVLVIASLRCPPSSRFGYDELPLYWPEPERRFPLLIGHGTRVAGLLVTRGLPGPEDPEAGPLP